MKKSFFLLLTIIPLCLSGCMLLPIFSSGVGGYFYYKGAARKELAASIKDVHHAGINAMRLAYAFIDEDTLGIKKATISGRLRDNRAVEMVIIPVTEESSQISIRVGVIGDRQQSLDLLHLIENELGFSSSDMFGEDDAGNKENGS